MNNFNIVSYVFTEKRADRQWNNKLQISTFVSNIRLRNIISLISVLIMSSHPDISKSLTICNQFWKCFGQTLCPILYLGNIHRFGQEVGWHITHQDCPFDIRYEVKLHTMNSLISTVIDIRRIWIKIPSVWIRNVWERQKEIQRSLEINNFPGMKFYLNTGLNLEGFYSIKY